MIVVAVLAAMCAAAATGRPRRRPARRMTSLTRSGAADRRCGPHRDLLDGDVLAGAGPDGGRGGLGVSARGGRGPRSALARGPVRLAGAAAGLAAGPLVLGGAFGWVVGMAAAVVALVTPRPSVQRVNPDDLAVVVDLVAGCLAAGTGLAAALEAAAVAADDVLQAWCHAVAAALRAGVPPEEAWRPWLADPWLAPVARTAVRTSATGAAAAADLRRTAARLRARRRAAAQHRVRQASVWLVAPLGLCFLPAFVLVAVVPLVLGLVPSLR